ncbi:MAG: SIMPL domain-containing protein, partial [Chlamydiales bacterium]|nr:SIMPL domain-containing protein [Chlamydiales bacterium]
MKTLKFKLTQTLCVLFLLFASTAWAKGPIVPKLSVSGNALLHKPADELSISVGVTTSAVTADEALNDNKVKMNEIITNLKAAGLEKGEFHTGQFSINPTYTMPPRDIPPDWRHTINGYEVTNTINIKTLKLNLASDFIDAAGQSKAVQISNISFGIRDTSIYRNEVIAVACGIAMKDAEAITNATGCQIVRVLDIKLDQPQIYSREVHHNMYMAKADMATFIEAPDVDLHAHVTVTFEIGQK